MRISIVVAMSENRAIGKDNQLLWHLPIDLQHFKQVTMGKPILMGRKTHQSIGRPLPGRINVVMTQDPYFKSEGCIVVHSIQDALDVVKNHDEICVIGGADLYRQFLPLSDRIYLTRVHHIFSADTFFPELNPDEWNEVKSLLHPADEKNPYACEMITLDRRLS